MQSKLGIAPAESFDIDLRWPGDLLKEPGRSFEYRRRTGQAGACEPCGEHRITAGFGRRDPFPVRERADTRQTQRNVIVDCKADGVAPQLREHDESQKQVMTPGEEEAQDDRDKQAEVPPPLEDVSLPLSPSYTVMLGVQEATPQYGILGEYSEDCSTFCRKSGVR